MTIDPNREAFNEAQKRNGWTSYNHARVAEEAWNAALAHAATKAEHAKNNPPLVVNPDGTMQKMSCAGCDALRDQVRVLTTGLNDVHEMYMNCSGSFRDASDAASIALTNTKQLGKGEK